VLDLIKSAEGIKNELHTVSSRKPTTILQSSAPSSSRTPPLVTEDEARKTYPRYTPSELALLEKLYTPSQLNALLAGEDAVSAADIANQGVLRDDPTALEHMDTTAFSTIHPLLDYPVRAPESNYDPNLRFKTEDELDEDLARWVQDLPADPDRVEWKKFTDKMRLMVGKEEAELEPTSYLAPDIPVLTDPIVVATAKMAASAADGVDERMKDLSRQIGIPVSEISRFRVKLLVNHRVVNQTRMGKIQSIYCLVVAGNQRGLLGIGEGKNEDLVDAQKQATLNAIRNMKPVPRYENRTIYGDVKGKVGATELTLYSRRPGMLSFLFV
jgi:small subunit ribosomal protein S5